MHHNTYHATTSCNKQRQLMPFADKAGSVVASYVVPAAYRAPFKGLVHTVLGHATIRLSWRVSN